MIRLTFSHIGRELGEGTPLLSGEGETVTDTQGVGLSFIRMLQDDIDTLTPTEFLALTNTIADPKDLDTYPAPNAWQWQAGITDVDAAFAASASDGLCLLWSVPEDSRSFGRVRSVVR